MMTQLYGAAALLAKYRFCGAESLVTPPDVNGHRW
jgi:hypothetical protein